MNHLALQSDYQQNGFVSPLKAMSTQQAQRHRQALEEIESASGQHPDFLFALNGGANFVLPLVDEVSTRKEILDCVEQLIGPDIVIYSASLFIKEAGTSQYVGWHQDLKYWGLSGTDEVTAWVALSPATVASGCMKMMPGSHRDGLVEHNDTFGQDNLLTRGQELAVDFDDARAVDIELAPGEFSLHHGYTFHGSRPNRSSDRRIGVSINYVAASMHVVSGVRPLVRMARGDNTHGHFEPARPPSGVLTQADVATMRRAKKISESVYYAGTDRRLATDRHTDRHTN